MKLEKWLKREGISQEAFGKLLNPPVSYVGVYYWCSDKKRPRDHYIDQIEKQTNGEVRGSDFVPPKR